VEKIKGDYLVHSFHASASAKEDLLMCMLVCFGLLVQ
jgi:hypothetical protein